MDDGNALFARLLAWMSVRVTPTMTRTELFFSAPIIAAWCFSVWMLIDVWRDLHALRRAGRNGALLTIKRADFRRECLLFLSLTGWMIACVPLLLNWRYATLTFIAGAFIYSWCRVANSILDRRYRMRQERYYERLSDLTAGSPVRQAPYRPVAEPDPTLTQGRMPPPP